MAGLYLVGAWLVVQVVGTVSPMLDAPDWVGRTVLALLAIGFFPTLVFSWLYELTPDGLKRDADVRPGESIAAETARRMDRLILLGIVALIAVIAADRFWPQAPTALEPMAAPAGATNGDQASAAVALAPTAAIDPNSIAVLPFVNMSADADNAYFSDGISEELLNVLVKVEGLSVASRTSSFAYKGREMSASAIGGELRVAHVLEGSVRKSGARVRITAQLIDAASDRHLWSETFDRELTDIFAIQDEIAKAIVGALRDTLGGAADAPAVAVRADTDNLDAYELYLKARELFLSRTDLEESVRLFERVVELDPDFARGWEGLAAATVVGLDWLVAPLPADERAARLARVEVAAARALALDPALSLPWAARSLAADYREPVDHHEVQMLLDRAIAADPRNASAHLWRGLNWVRVGYFERAMSDLERCLALDPAYGNCLRWKALVLLFQGHTDTALALFEQGMAQGFNTNRGNSFVEPLIRRGDVLAAILLMRELNWPIEIQRAAVAAIRDGRPPPDLRALIATLRLQHPETRFEQYTWGLLLRDYALAAEAEDLRITHVQHWDPAYTGLRRSPAFKRMLERTNAPAYWRAHGFPPQCRPLGDSDFECDEPGAAR